MTNLCLVKHFRNRGTPGEFAEQLSKNEYVLSGSRKSKDVLTKQIKQPLIYSLFSISSFISFILVSTGNMLPLIARTNTGSLIIAMTSILDLKKV